MKRLFLNTSLLIVPLILIIILFPIKRRWLFQELTEDCANRSIWIYDRIFENDKPVDIAFLGSSRTYNGINDKLLEEKLNINVLNIGYCRFGENLTYVLLKELVKKKEVKTIIVEVREDGDRYSHPVFPYIAESKDVFFANPLFNKDLFNDYYRHIYYKLEAVKGFIFNELKNAQVNKSDYGFGSFPDTASFDLLSTIERKKSKKVELTQFERNFHMKFSRIYLKKMFYLCKKNKIAMYFLYLPSYASTNQIPKEYFTYLKYGKLLIPPNKILENKSNWYDENHLNQTGAKDLSNWLGFELQKHISPDISTK